MKPLVLVLVLVCAGCNRNIEIEKVIKVEDVHTGWYDAGLQPDGKNKLVPSISLKLRNVGAEAVSSVQLNAIFRRVNEPEGAAPGALSGPIVLRSNLGYTGTQSRLQLLQNREFVDSFVDIFAKHGSRTWVKMGQYKIDRQLLSQ
jgi:hypothetical protein